VTIIIFLGNSTNLKLYKILRYIRICEVPDFFFEQMKPHKHSVENITMNISQLLSFQWLLLFSITSFITSVPATRFNNIPRLGLLELQDPLNIVSNTVSEDFQTFYYNQTLDHFNYRPDSYAKFLQRYFINFKYWCGTNATAPIFAYFGDEAALDSQVPAIGFLTDNAAKFNALLVYIEHRYYGQSNPDGSMEKSLENADSRGYFNSEQAIADYAAIILHIKKTYLASYSPVIVIGGSYGGMLASWFRLKYPHIALGALASSAPILYFDDITPQNSYYSVVTKDFKEASVTCYQTIKDSWPEIDKVANEPNGLATLSKKFNTCKPLTDESELTNYLETVYASVAQYNRPPRYPVTVVCGGIDAAPFGTDILSKIFAGVVAYAGNNTCYVNQPSNTSETSLGWAWQTCSEMVIPIGIENNTMFPSDPFNLTEFIEGCTNFYGVPPRPHWVTTYYGGHDIKLILKRFASNIIFSNGLRDPYSSGGVLENISDSVVAVHTVNGSHCLDILTANSSDPPWLVMQRKEEVRIIEEWIAMYNADLQAFMR
ncbi:Peptidase_S28 domain-containing protein, partial [Cephalotus follicularis]